jgi:hypothetical protein
VKYLVEIWGLTTKSWEGGLSVCHGFFSFRWLASSAAPDAALRAALQQDTLLIYILIKDAKFIKNYN